MPGYATRPGPATKQVGVLTCDCVPRSRVSSFGPRFDGLFVREALDRVQVSVLNHFYK